MNAITRKLRTRRASRAAGHGSPAATSMQRELLVAAARQNIVR